MYFYKGKYKNKINKEITPLTHRQSHLFCDKIYIYEKFLTQKSAKYNKNIYKIILVYDKIGP